MIHENNFIFKLQMTISVLKYTNLSMWSVEED